MAPETVDDLEKALFRAFPKQDAESWDNVGLAVGDRMAPLGKVALNLDMSVEAVIAAHVSGCNVLVTHHPPFIADAPLEFGPVAQTFAPAPGRVIYEAASRGVNLINMHTNADRAIATREKFAQMLEINCVGNCESVLDKTRELLDTGFGALLECGDAGPIELGALASKCKRVFGGSPRVWGDAKRRIQHIAYLNGSWRDADLYEKCMRAGIECVIVGETGYHLCLDAQPYLSIIELGHDLSELPIVDVLYDALVHAELDEAKIVRLHCSDANWWPAE